jgi:hypothetical protein
MTSADKRIALDRCLEARAIIAFLLDDETVSVVGVFYGSQDYETALGSEDG